MKEDIKSVEEIQDSAPRNDPRIPFLQPLALLRSSQPPPQHQLARPTLLFPVPLSWRIKRHFGAGALQVATTKLRDWCRNEGSDSETQTPP